MSGEEGPNGFLDSVPETLAFARDLGLAERVQRSDDRARRRFIFRHGRLHVLPGGPVGFLSSGLLSWPGKLRIAGEPFAASRPAGDETIHAFASRRIGREAADVLVGSMVSGVFAGDARALSLRACFPKMWQMETEHGGLFRALFARMRERRVRRGDAVGSPLGTLTSFRDGIQTLTDILTAAVDPEADQPSSSKSISSGGPRRVGGRKASPTAQPQRPVEPLAVWAATITRSTAPPITAPAGESRPRQTPT